MLISISVMPKNHRNTDAEKKNAAILNIGSNLKQKK
jgi:hypothetical protein